MNPIYTILHTLVRITLPLYYRKIHVTGIENFPQDKPVLLAVNHQNAFLDGVLVAYKLDKQLYFLARSDAFKGKFGAKILKSMNLVPIYRKQDGTGVENNAQVFQWCYKTLEDHKPVLIFPEGTCEPHKHMFPLKKGMARIALGAVDSHPEMDLQIVPVALNYEDHMAFRSKVWVDFGTPISVQKVVSHFSSSGHRVKNLTNSVENELRKMVLHIEKENYNEHHEIVMHNVAVHQPQSGKEMVELAKSKNKSEHPAPKDSTSVLAMILSFPFLLFHRPLYYCIDWLAAKFTGKDEFFPSVKYGLLALAFPFYWLFLSFLFGGIIGFSFLEILLFWFVFPITAWVGMILKGV
jgi:1-acyl-sn-glycerol-3-phosphate acyltransferase